VLGETGGQAEEQVYRVRAEVDLARNQQATKKKKTKGPGPAPLGENHC